MCGTTDKIMKGASEMTQGKQPVVWEGQLDGSNKKFAIVVSRFNRLVTERLVEGAIDCLTRHGVEAGSIQVAWVPGAWEIPPVVWRFARSAQFHGVIALGCVIHGATAHAAEISSNLSSTLGQCAIETGVPISHGVITPDNNDQALDRSGMKTGNRGWDAAMAALEMASLMEAIPGGDR
jgi:6,7-dimethyl-8-ribityllumazine synthase